MASKHPVSYYAEVAEGKVFVGWERFTDEHTDWTDYSLCVYEHGLVDARGQLGPPSRLMTVMPDDSRHPTYGTVAHALTALGQKAQRRLTAARKELERAEVDLRAVEARILKQNNR